MNDLPLEPVVQEAALERVCMEIRERLAVVTLQSPPLNIFDFDLSPDDMAAIATLETGQSAFFDHRDPAMVKMLASSKRNT